MGRKRLAAETGRVQYGFLTVLSEFYQIGQRHPRLLCVCVCGVVKDLDRHHVLTGHSTSCGCQPSRLKHGHARKRGLRSPTHLVWSAMWQRCTNPDNPKWQEYGGRGITVCERWKEFKNFLEDMGPRPAGMQGKRALYSIERMDNDGNYEPGNCKWATAKEQRANQRSFPSRPNRRAYSRSGQHIGSTG